ncbi:MAG: nucleotidyltransferase family protein, partial [Paludibacter sp.]|nr:nucleotidyltransferase family protein [Paludibacter sp.]
HYPSQHIVRLKGIIRFFHFKNLDLISGFKKIAVILNENNIPILLMKGIAMRYYFNQTPRCMWDVDFLVPDKYYRQSIDIAIANGFKKKNNSDFNYFVPHSTDLVNDRMSIDIHRSLHDDNNHQAKVIDLMLENANEVHAFGAKVMIPRPEDLLLMIAVNGYNNRYVNRDGHNDDNSWMIDFALLINESENFEWEYFYRNATALGCSYIVDFMLSQLQYYTQQLKLPTDIAEHLKNNNQIDSRVKHDIYEKELWALSYKIGQNKTIKASKISVFSQNIPLRFRKYSIMLLKTISIDAFFRFYDFKTFELSTMPHLTIQTK